MFGIKTEETGVEVMGTYSAWDKYMGHLWYNLLDFCNLQEKCTVVEFAPGNSVKIAQSLYKCCFKGELHLIDPCPAVLDNLFKKYTQLLPQATIYPVCSRLIDSINNLPHKPDFLVSNHALDDLLLSKAQNEELGIDFFNWSLKEEELVLSDLQRFWSRLENDKVQLERYKKEIVDEIILTIETIVPQCFITNQYASHVLNKNNLSTLNYHAREILNKIKERYQEHVVSNEVVQTLLNANKNYNNQQIGNEVLDASNWLLLGYPIP